VSLFTRARNERVDFRPFEGSRDASGVVSSQQIFGDGVTRRSMTTSHDGDTTGRRVAGCTALTSAGLLALLTFAPHRAFAQTIPSAQAVLAALAGTPEPAAAFEGRPAAMPMSFAPPEPGRLRPCCAFGGEMRVKLIGIPLPCYRHRPVRGPADIGPHEYDPGVLQILPSPIHTEGDGPKREHNGIVYTCRGGFLDTAHVRDFADLAWFLAARVEPLLETGGTIELVDYGGTRRVTVRPVPPGAIERIGRTRLAVAVAGRLSFDLSVWREIATWYGYESVPPWPEKLSSFSPEDLYSNLLGTKIAEGILSTQPIASRRDWDLAMTAWLRATMDVLGTVPGDTARELMNSVDEVFWSSSHWIPDWRITRRRKFDRGPVVEPWVVHAEHERAETCDAAAAPVLLPVSDDLDGVSVDAVAEIDIAASDWLVRHDFPLPRAPSRHIVEDDFAGLIEAVRKETEAGLRDDTKPLQSARMQ
jgi:hypothetical protein